MREERQTLLIIEDDYFQQELLKIWLEAENYNVIIAANGDKALQAVTECKPDLILLDLVMPGLNGFQVAQKLKDNPDTKTIPIVVVTVIDAQNKRVEALEIGIDDFLNKPVDRIELLVRVKNLLQSRAYFKQLQNRKTHLLQLESLASLGTLITSVTNEINKPLQNLQKIIEKARIQCTECVVNESLNSLLIQAETDIERIDLVVHNMGLYIESISQQTRTEFCDSSLVLSQVLELLSNKMEESCITVQTEIASNLPLVLCSAEGLMHVLVHLILNAHDTLQNYSQACIKIAISPLENKQLLISVCDNNAENADNMYSLITDPLFSAKLPQVCTGLGLALACHFIEKSGGSMSIDSATGRGCCMKVVLKTQ